MKPMTFEEWDEKTSEHDGGYRQWFDWARQGMIAEDDAIRIPPVSEWPPESTHIWVVYTKSHTASLHDDPDTIATIHRPTKQWTPKVGEAVFWNPSLGGVSIARVTKTSGDVVCLDTSNGETSDKIKYLKPFDPAYIGKPWNEIPGFLVKEAGFTRT